MNEDPSPTEIADHLSALPAMVYFPGVRLYSKMKNFAEKKSGTQSFYKV